MEDNMTAERNSLNFPSPIKLDSPSTPDAISVCRCLLSDGDSPKETEVPLRKQKIFSTVTRTENYLRERRIPELVRFIMAKVLASNTNNPVAYVKDLLDECMVFRAGIGNAPVLFEHRHLQAVVNSFDPSGRGWVTTGQVRRAYYTLGLPPPEPIEERMTTAELMNGLKETQERELLELLSAGIDKQEYQNINMM
ncbi:uncharacterized protein LOC111359089 [Spodoptera litura]|uniref:Uncharacterized protein LOC111359089 n=1 Tax=Spodoptera litura TaxID=69820 RepID=A0A9J7EGH5_SPOLT|nr:uncharacterized protein LOC111359089 [Spodoptera litura]